MNRLRRLRVGLRTLLAVSMAVLAVSAAHAADVVLDDLERYYLSQTPVITLCVDPDWSPFESIDENGQYVGISADLLRLISIRTGVRFSLRPTKTWDESIEQTRSGSCQALSFLNETPERKDWLAFTDPVFTDVNVFITREEHPFISDPSGLVGATLVLPKGTGVEEFVRKRYPNLRITTVESENDAFRIVSERQADMTLRSLIMAAYTIKKDGWFNLKISGQLPEFNNKLRIGLTRDRQNLVSILNKGIATITAQDRETIVNRHISINAQTVEDYALAWKVATVLLLVLAVASAWVRQLRKHNRELALLSQTDGLTGLFNRSKLNTIIDYEFARARRMGHPIAMILLDLDDFKHVNDRFGHLMGDAVLKELGRLLTDNVREMDMVGRWGGEEFLIICPETDTTGAMTLANRVVEAVRRHAFSTKSRQTVSAGVATLTAADTPDSLLSRADKALYAAKAAGRDRACVDQAC